MKSGSSGWGLWTLAPQLLTHTRRCALANGVLLPIFIFDVTSISICIFSQCCIIMTGYFEHLQEERWKWQPKFNTRWVVAYCPLRTWCNLNVLYPNYHFVERCLWEWIFEPRHKSLFTLWAISVDLYFSIDYRFFRVTASYSVWKIRPDCVAKLYTLPSKGFGLLPCTTLGSGVCFFGGKLLLLGKGVEWRFNVDNAHGIPSTIHALVRFC